ncbi:Chlorite dismutase, partial [mine drainage metagenome]
MADTAVSPGPTTAAAVGAIRVRDASAPARRQLVRFAFYRVDLAWRRLDPEARRSQLDEALAVLDRHAERLLLRTHTLVGTRGDADCMLWAASEDAERLHQLFRDLNRSRLGGYLVPAY